MEARIKCWLEKDGEVVLSNGKADLLQFIDELGSIQKGAEKIGMSYRHAWGIVREMESRAGFPFLEAQAGGRQGGRARLTPRGRRLLYKFQNFRRGLDEDVRSKFKAAFGVL